MLEALLDWLRGRPREAAAPRTSTPRAAPRVARAPGEDPPARDADSWTATLDRARERLSAEAMFVLDAQGLAIAVSGQVPTEDVEALGIRLLLAFEQVESMRLGGQDPNSVIVGFGEQWATALRLSAAEAEDGFLLGVLGAFPVFRRKAVADLRASFDELLGVRAGLRAEGEA